MLQEPLLLCVKKKKKANLCKEYREQPFFCHITASPLTLKPLLFQSPSQVCSPGHTWHRLSFVGSLRPYSMYPLSPQRRVWSSWLGYMSTSHGWLVCCFKKGKEIKYEATFLEWSWLPCCHGYLPAVSLSSLWRNLFCVFFLPHHSNSAAPSWLAHPLVRGLVSVSFSIPQLVNLQERFLLFLLLPGMHVGFKWCMLFPVI